MMGTPTNVVAMLVMGQLHRLSHSQKRCNPSHTNSWVHWPWNWNLAISGGGGRSSLCLPKLCLLHSSLIHSLLMICLWPVSPLLYDSLQMHPSEKTLGMSVFGLMLPRLFFWSKYRCPHPHHPHHILLLPGVMTAENSSTKASVSK